MANITVPALQTTNLGIPFDPARNFLAAAQVKNALAQGQMNAFALQDAQDQRASRNAFSQAVPGLLNPDTQQSTLAGLGKTAPSAVPQAAQFIEAYSKLGDEQRKRAKAIIDEKNDTVASFLNPLKQVKDPAQRQQIFQQSIPQLQADGIGPEILQHIDLSDQGIDRFTQSTLHLKDQLAEADKAADRNVKAGTLAETVRNDTGNLALRGRQIDQTAMLASPDYKGRVAGAEEAAKLKAQTSAFGGADNRTQIDPTSTAITAQTGLSLNAFRYLTGKATDLPRDKATRNQAASEAQTFANKNGIDVSTLTSRYKAYNEVLEKNIERVSQTGVMQDELAGTIDTFKPVADAVGAGKLRIANVAKIWAGGEVNDPVAQQYRQQILQLRTELAGYNGAVQGRSGNSLTKQDYDEAEKTIKDGLSSGGAEGLRSAIASSTSKMTNVLNRNVDLANKRVWDLFGVGKNYKNQTPSEAGVAPHPNADPGAIEEARRRGLIK